MDPTLTSDRLEAHRFAPEREAQMALTERFGLLDAARAVPDSVVDLAERELRAERSKLVHISRAMSPDLHRSLDLARERLDFPLPVELLLDPSEAVNAAAYPLPRAREVCVIALTAGAVERLSQDELTCVLGHELGHLAYGHTLLAHSIALAYHSVPLPAILEARLRSLGRLQELSADRAGALAVELDYEIAARTEIRVGTGLDPRRLRIDESTLEAEVARLAALDVPEHLFQSTHPLLPLRLRALEWFCTGSAEDGRVLELVRLMEYEAATDLARHQRDLLLSGGLLAARLDEAGELTEAERLHLEGLVLPFTDDPESELARIADVDEAEQLFRTSASWLRENAGPERFEMLSQLMEVALHDGEVTDAERAFVVEAADLLDIPHRWALDQLTAALHTQSLTTGAPRRFGLRSRR